MLKLNASSLNQVFDVDIYPDKKVLIPSATYYG